MVTHHHHRNSLGHPTEGRTDRRRWRYFPLPVPVFKFRPVCFDDQRADWIRQQPLHFALESFAFPADTSDEIRQAFPLDCDDMLQAENRVVTGGQRAGDRFQRFQVKRDLLAGVDHRRDLVSPQEFAHRFPLCRDPRSFPQAARRFPGPPDLPAPGRPPDRSSTRRWQRAIPGPPPGPTGRSSP